MENSSSNSTVFNIQLSPIELWFQLIVLYIFLCGIVAFVGSGLMAVGIIRTKKLRSRFLVIVCALLITRCLLSWQFLLIGAYRILRNLNLAPKNMPRMGCYFVHFHLYYVTLSEMLLLLVLVIDRILAIAFYRFYRLLNARQAVIACITVCVISVLVKAVPIFLKVHEFLDSIDCANVNSPNPVFVQLQSQHADLCAALLILLLYTALILYIYCRLIPNLKKAATQGGDQSAMTALKRQLKLMPLLRRLVSIHCGLALSSVMYEDKSIQCLV